MHIAIKADDDKRLKRVEYYNDVEQLRPEIIILWVFSICAGRKDAYNITCIMWTEINKTAPENSGCGPIDKSVPWFFYVQLWLLTQGRFQRL